MVARLEIAEIGAGRNPGAAVEDHLRELARDAPDRHAVREAGADDQMMAGGRKTAEHPFGILRLEDVLDHVHHGPGPEGGADRLHGQHGLAGPAHFGSRGHQCHPHLDLAERRGTHRPRAGTQPGDGARGGAVCEECPAFQFSGPQYI